MLIVPGMMRGEGRGRERDREGEGRERGRGGGRKKGRREKMKDKWRRVERKGEGLSYICTCSTNVHQSSQPESDMASAMSGVKW